MLVLPPRVVRKLHEPQLNPDSPMLARRETVLYQLEAAPPFQVRSAGASVHTLIPTGSAFFTLVNNSDGRSMSGHVGTPPEDY